MADLVLTQAVLTARARPTTRHGLSRETDVAYHGTGPGRGAPRPPWTLIPSVCDRLAVAAAARRLSASGTLTRQGSQVFLAMAGIGRGPPSGWWLAVDWPVAGKSGLQDALARRQLG